MSDADYEAEAREVAMMLDLSSAPLTDETNIATIAAARRHYISLVRQPMEAR